MPAGGTAMLLGAAQCSAGTRAISMKPRRADFAARRRGVAAVGSGVATG
jgi:hypothetical protein